MPSVRVYNTRQTPVVYGNGKTIGGGEWHTVDRKAVQSFIDDGSLIVMEVSSKDRSSTPVVEVVAPSAPKDAIAEEASDAPSIEDEPATISTSRRRKSQPEKE